MTNNLIAQLLVRTSQVTHWHSLSDGGEYRMTVKLHHSVEASSIKMHLQILLCLGLERDELAS